MIEIDGSQGEGGGQIVRSALALSIITKKPFRMTNVRARREKPGLLNQHLTAVNAAVSISTAEVEGNTLGSKQLSFSPNQAQPGKYHFSIGTAGSTTLVFQTILPPLMVAEEKSIITLEGGTHNPMAPPFEFLKQTFLPALSRMGVEVDANLKSYGFYPKGGGSLSFEIKPAKSLVPLHLGKMGAITSIDAKAIVVKLPDSIGHRELRALEEELPRLNNKHVVDQRQGPSQGNILLVHVTTKDLTETITSIGKQGLPAESVAKQAADETKRYLTGQAAVGEHLADQLLIPMAMCQEGSFLTGTLTDHTTTNIDVIEKFLDVEIKTTEVSPSLWKVEILKR